MKTHLQTESLTNKSKCSKNFGDLNPAEETKCNSVLENQTTWSMQDGERCVYKYAYIHGNLFPMYK